MKTLDIFGAILAIGVGLAVLAGFFALIYFWWFGVLTGFEHFGVPMIIGFICSIALIILSQALGAFLLGILGFWASIVLLDMWWFWALCLYATRCFSLGQSAFW